MHIESGFRENEQEAYRKAVNGAHSDTHGTAPFAGKQIVPLSLLD